MRQLTMLILILLSVTGLDAQNVFFPTKVGTVLTYSTVNPKGKV